MTKRFAVNRHWQLSWRYNLWLEHCRHRNKNETPIGDEFHWSRLCRMSNNEEKEVGCSVVDRRDVCFHIWHEGIIR